jgi:hypothetical protein
MSLSVVVTGPDYLVFATESRMTVDINLPTGTTVRNSYDATDKLLTFDAPHNYIAAVTYGHAAIGDRTIYSFIPEIEVELAEESRMSVKKFAKKLSDFFVTQWNKIPESKHPRGADITFLVGGFNERELYSHTYEMHIPMKPDPIELPQTGLKWGGQRDLVDRLIKGYDPRLVQYLAQAWSLTEEQKNAVPAIAQPLELVFPYNFMALQDYVDIAKALLRMTIEIERLTACERVCGGPIDVATITRRDGLRYVQRKRVEAEIY